MAKSSADDEELRRACEAALESTKQKIVMSIRVAKSRGIWGKTGKLGRSHTAKPRVIAISNPEGEPPFCPSHTTMMCDIVIDLPITLNGRPKLLETSSLGDDLSIKSHFHVNFMWCMHL
ncbi:hypothetical protein MTR67_050408 [Solanum verrucosum]|uniref:Uncharacterized protein n=1 Tax=Solanum verrucosum TaxID=315347 RepID=A0AAF0V1F5_SOLVR|nr:hypothetical protein MTR67_050408 [Solanum verrucosum]